MTSGVALPDFDGGLFRSTSALAPGAGDGAPSFVPAAAASRSARSCCLRSFLRSLFARSFSALSSAAWLGAPPFSFGVSRPEPAGGGGVEGFDFEPVTCGGRGFSAATGVAAAPVPVPLGVTAAPVVAPCVGSCYVAEPGVAATVEGVTVRRYA